MLARSFARSLVRGAFLAAVCSGGLAAQVAACPGTLIPYFGWDATECGNCSIYGSYLEYHTPPGVRSIRANGPASGRIEENDTLLAVDGHAITTPDAWHEMRDAEPGRAMRFLVRRRGDTTTATVAPSTRCVPASQNQSAYRIEAVIVAGRRLVLVRPTP